MARSLKMPEFEWEWQKDLWLTEHPDWKEERNEYAREWAKNNTEKRTSAQERWRKAHPERWREINRRAQQRYRAKYKAIREAERKAIAELEQQGEPRPDADSIE